MSQPPSDSGRHRNDIYGNFETPPPDGGSPLIPAATVVLLRESPQLEVLMLHRTSKVAFGGMWVFPGGRIDPADHDDSGDIDTAARNAAARETHEEAGLIATPDAFVHFSHWTPPPSTPKRFSTWFFAATAEGHKVAVDGSEIQDHAWLTPADALARHAAGEIDLAPPTWISLFQLTRQSRLDPLLATMRAQPPRIYETRLARRADDARVAMWRGDAGYETSDANVEGPRHRLVMQPGGFVFENDVDPF